MQHHHVALRHDQTVLIFTLGRDALNQAEEPVAPWRYMGAVLNIVRRPELLGCDEVLLVEQGLERFEDKCLVSLGCRLAHFGCPWFCFQRFSLFAGIEITPMLQKLQEKELRQCLSRKAPPVLGRWLSANSSEF